MTKLIIATLVGSTGGLVLASILPQIAYALAFVALFVDVLLLSKQRGPRVATQKIKVATKHRSLPRRKQS